MVTHKGRDPGDLRAASWSARFLTDDQCTPLAAQIYDWHRHRRIAQLKQLDVLREHAKEGGRGHKKTLPANSRAKPRDVMRTEIMQRAEVTDHKAKQALQVARDAPELLDGVIRGETKLREASRKAKVQSPPRPRPSRRPPWNMEKQCARVMGLVVRLASLTDDQRAALAAQIYDWHRHRRMAELKRLDVLREHAKEGGRGHKKTLPVNSLEKARDVMRTEIIQRAEVTDHKAKQALQVARDAPELLDGVIRGEMKLREASKRAKVKCPPQRRSPRPPPWNTEKQCARVMGLVVRLAAQCPTAERRQFCRWIARQCEGIV
jgi:hypothetical protein